MGRNTVEVHMNRLGDQRSISTQEKGKEAGEKYEVSMRNLPLEPCCCRQTCNFWTASWEPPSDMSAAAWPELFFPKITRNMNITACLMYFKSFLLRLRWSYLTSVPEFCTTQSFAEMASKQEQKRWNLALVRASFLRIDILVKPALEHYTSIYV